MRPIEDRLERLERRMGVWRGLTLMLAVTAAALLFAGASDDVPRHLRVRGLELVNDAGATVLRLRAWPVGGLVEVMNNVGETTTWIGQTGDAHGMITISTRDGRPAVGAGSLNDAGHGFLGLFSSEGKLGLKLQGGRDSGTGGLFVLYDGAEREAGRLDGDAAGLGRLQLKDRADWQPLDPR